MSPESRRALNVLLAAALVGWLVIIVVIYRPKRAGSLARRFRYNRAAAMQGT